MKILQTLLEKPWTAEQIPLDNAHNGIAYALPTAKLGLRVLLSAITVLLALFVIAYSDRMTLSDWHPLSEPWLIWVNTLILVLSSVAMNRALAAARDRRIGGIKTWFLAAGGSALLFLLGQLFVWQQLLAAGYYAAGHPAAAFFYLLTALHGIHLFGGLVAWGRVMARLGKNPDMAKLHESVDLCTAYWHYLLVVWLIFFTLLLFT
ncbi:MAG: cytochrome c oxidase subunit 3 [Alphaproteobacteria bacterium]